MGLGWDVASTPKSGGFWVVYSVAAVVMIVSIWMHLALCLTRTNPSMQFGLVNCSQKDGSIVHTGDNRTGAGDGDDEVINVDLSASLRMYSHWYLLSIALRVKRLRKLQMRLSYR